MVSQAIPQHEPAQACLPPKPLNRIGRRTKNAKDSGHYRQAAAVGGVGLQTARDWVLRFNAEGPSRLATGKAPGNQPLLGEVERAALRQVVEEGPTPAIHGVVRWRIVDLMQWL